MKRALAATLTVAFITPAFAAEAPQISAAALPSTAPASLPGVATPAPAPASAQAVIIAQPVQSTFNDKGVTGTAGVVGAIAFVPIAGFFMTGTSAVIAKATPVTGFLDEDLPILIAANPAPPAVVVPAGPVQQAPGAVPAPSSEQSGSAKLVAAGG